MPYHCHDSMAEKDSNQEALEQVEKATDSEPVSGDELLESPDLKRQLKEGENFPLTLTFEKAGPIEVSVRVGKVGAMVDPSGVTHSGG